MPDRIVPINHERLEVLANYLERCGRAEELYSASDFAWEGAPGSQAESERSYLGPDPIGNPWTSRVVSTAYASAHIGLSSMADQAHAMARLLTSPTIDAEGTLGVDVCCRSAIEIGSRVFWLMEPGITPLERASRSIVDQLYSSFQAEELARAMEWSEPVNVLGLAPTSADIRARCVTLGLPVGGDPRHPMVNGEGRPTATKLITELVAATPYRDFRRMVYSVLSATTHGTLFGLLRWYYMTDETHKGEQVLQRRADHRIVEASAGLTMLTFAVILQRIVGMMGWDHWRATSLYRMIGNLLSEGPR